MIFHLAWKGPDADGYGEVYEVYPAPVAPYATLSYCWGGDQDAKTLRSNFASYQDHIDFSTLPTTIQDAAIVTIQIGLSYLWVDAMCIIQDDDNDKMKEIAKMHAIYRSSQVTIAPSEAATSKTGFLRPRDMWRPIKMKARFDENVFSDVLLVPEGSSCRSSAPLFRRGWTLQETCRDALKHPRQPHAQRKDLFLKKTLYIRL
ncbi:hypothetical protein CGCSCA4_v009786 [Colletotrichum siamense]|nr:hypothetical protein CGCSCA4_v009786 [Colletotrichum siamense]